MTTNLIEQARNWADIMQRQGYWSLAEHLRQLAAALEQRAEGVGGVDPVRDALQLVVNTYGADTPMWNQPRAALKAPAQAAPSAEPARAEVSDARIDEIAAAQDDEGWFVSRLTALEWRAFARDVLALSNPPVAQPGQEPCGNRDYCSRFPFCGCGGPQPLPERDTSKPAEQQGLFRKFDVRRTDGSDKPGGKHHGCEYFVLDVNHDKHAPAALAAYADAVAATHPHLADDMRERYELPASTPVAQEQRGDAEPVASYFIPPALHEGVVEHTPGSFTVQIDGLTVRQIKEIFEDKFYGSMMWSGGAAYPTDGVSIKFKRPLTTPPAQASDAEDALVDRMRKALKTSKVGELAKVDHKLAQAIDDAALAAATPALLEIRKRESRLSWLHSPESHNVDGYEWGIYRVKWENGRAVEVLQTLSDFSDLDAAIDAAITTLRQSPGETT